jgi:hypothetical protein
MKRTGSGWARTAAIAAAAWAMTAQAAPPEAAGGGRRANVVRQPDGDIRVDNFPMVDQGGRGYCGPATIARHVQYLGGGAAVNDIAAAWAESSEAGKGPKGLIAAFDRKGKSWGARARIVYDMEPPEMRKALTEYNRLARKEKKTPYTIEDDRLPGNPEEIYGTLDASVWVRARAADTAGMKAFAKIVAKSIDGGIPLAWGVQLGLVKENGELRQTGGGHMRTILGINPARGEILFSDSWGKGHELKRMSLTDAWAISSHVIVVEPR